MTNEKLTFELLMEAESMGIRQEVLELSNKIRQENELMDINLAIEKAYKYLKTQQENRNEHN